MIKISERIKCVEENIASACARSSRDRKDVKLIVVTKSAAFEAIQEVIRLGYTSLGENRVQQLKKVTSQMSDLLKDSNPKLLKQIEWHMIGHLQRNKVRQALPLTAMVHSVDTLRLAEEINSAAKKLNIKSKILLQINTSNEPQKYGVPVGAAIHLAEQLETLTNIQLAGLMTMGPLTRDKDVVRACFTRAYEIFVEMKGERVVSPQFSELSMGMSSDYEIAVEEGATILRIGSAIFSG